MTKEYYEYYKSHGICPGCGQEKPVKGRVYCVNCAEAQAVCNMVRRAKMTVEEKAEENRRNTQKKMMLRNKRKSMGMCIYCGNPARENKTTCARCAGKINARHKRR